MELNENELKKFKCVMCGAVDTFLVRNKHGQIVREVFIYTDKKTGEHLCKEHSVINEMIYHDRGEDSE